MTEKVMVCRPFITLKNGKVKWAYEVGLKAFCFMGDKDYKPKKKKAQ